MDQNQLEKGMFEVKASDLSRVSGGSTAIDLTLTKQTQFTQFTTTTNTAIDSGSRYLAWIVTSTDKG